ncbi:DNA mismatch repair protein MSH6 isoform X2 [Amborella trichopoda]|uniref:DNA mismatch repair protein MSH6 isoform X2 n=1 Tax=Amborella trichopoda TaxID=13333 RepID=UPI0009BFB172|nr:DNA mismatch repair protein MSH6 isoform X2 [Amborella trichopoda]|eukprot:XP_020521076.1 DNA mismatch repair protein MSH6 isoform X2 [Amborella trichopoda]
MAPTKRTSSGGTPAPQQRPITFFFSPGKPAPSPPQAKEKSILCIGPSLSPLETSALNSGSPVNLAESAPTKSASKTTSKSSRKLDDSGRVVSSSPNTSSNFESPVNLFKSGSSMSPALASKSSRNLGTSPLSNGCTTVSNGEGVLYGEEFVGRRIRVYWPLDKEWYEGCIKAHDKPSGKHIVLYDDAQEEELDLEREKIEWVEPPSKRRGRLRRVSDTDKRAISFEDETEEKELSVSGGISDDYLDEDWDKNVKNGISDDSDDADLELKNPSQASKKRKKGQDSINLGSRSGRKPKGGTEGRFEKSGDSQKFNFKDKGNAVSESPKTPNNVHGELKQCLPKDCLTADVAGRFCAREAEKFEFLGTGRRDANGRKPGDLNYDSKTLYLPQKFLKGLTGAQRQWWDFKSKHMDKVLFFKMGKFYELFEMDAHTGAKELELQYMAGEQPHCGFPEKNFSVNVEKLARKGYRVLVVEQIETPDQLELRRREMGSKDKVVKREACAVITKGTLAEGEMMSMNPDASYLMSVTEDIHTSMDEKNDDTILGICIVDVSTSKFMLGQFGDDAERRRLCSILSELRPVELIKPTGALHPETEKVLIVHTRDPLVNELVPGLEFWDAERTISELTNLYKLFKENIALGCLSDTENLRVCENPHIGESELEYLPIVISELVGAGENGQYALSAFGGCLFYLRQAYLDESVLRFAKFESLLSLGVSNAPQRSYMTLDAAALENLEIFENNCNRGTAGTLFAQVDHCVTAFGKRLLRNWLARPLNDIDSILDRQNAIADLKNAALSSALEFRKEMFKLPDMERLLARVFANSEAKGRNASNVVLYEDAAKKQLVQFLAALRGCQSMASAYSSFANALDCMNSNVLRHLLTPGKGVPDIEPMLKYFVDAFDWSEADRTGHVVPHEGGDVEYDSACKTVKDIETCLARHLKEQRKALGDASINYVSVGKDHYLLEVPESLQQNIPRDYELRSSRKGYFRYWTPEIMKFLGELSHAEAEKDASLKTILQRFIVQFCEHHKKWRQLVSAVAELDALTSLAIASEYFEGPACCPTILRMSSSGDGKEGFSLFAENLGHPILRSDALGKGSFVPNDLRIGTAEGARFILLTGPNMGGKSTLLRQVCLAVILAQVGSYVPAESFQLSPVDRIFVRMGARDNIFTGQSTFLTELSETSSMLFYMAGSLRCQLHQIPWWHWMSWGVEHQPQMDKL